MKHFFIFFATFCLICTISMGVILASNNGNHTFAATTNPVDEACKTAPDNPYCQTKKNPPTKKDNPVLITLNKVIKMLALIAGAVAVIWIIYGGFRFVTSYGNAEKITAARETILYALIGLIIIVVAQSLISFIISKVTK